MKSQQRALPPAVAHLVLVRPMRLHSIFAALTLVLVASAGAAASPARDELGPLRAPPLRTDDLLRRVRHFIATHWLQHRRGHVIYTLHAPPDEPLRGEFWVDRADDGTWHIRGASHTVRSGRPVHSFEAVSLHYYGRYLYFRDHAGRTVGML